MEPGEVRITVEMVGMLPGSSLWARKIIAPDVLKSWIGPTEVLFGAVTESLYRKILANLDTPQKL
jgi:hypothetical protein